MFGKRGDVVILCLPEDEDVERTFLLLKVAGDVIDIADLDSGEVVNAKVNYNLVYLGGKYFRLKKLFPGLGHRLLGDYKLSRHAS